MHVQLTAFDSALKHLCKTPPLLRLGCWEVPHSGDKALLTAHSGKGFTQSNFCTAQHDTNHREFIRGGLVRNGNTPRGRLDWTHFPKWVKLRQKGLLDVLSRGAALGERTSKSQPALLVSFQGLIVLNESSFLSRTSSSVGSAHLKGFFGEFFRSLAAAGKAQAEGAPELH